MSVVEYCSTILMVHKWALSCPVCILHVTAVGAVEFFSTCYMVHMWALSSSARNSTWYRSLCCRILVENLHGTELGSVEFCSTFYMVQKWALSNSARHFILYRSGRSRVLLDLLRGTEVSANESCSTIHIVQKWSLWSSARLSTLYRNGSCLPLLDILHVTEGGAVDFYLTFYMVLVCVDYFCSTFYMVQKCALTSFTRKFTWYRIGSSRILLDFLHGTEVGDVGFWSVFYMVHNVGAVESCSIFFMLQKRALRSSTQQSTWYRIGSSRDLLDVLHGTEMGAL